MNKQEHIYLKNLDGLRFICFLMVFLFHSFFTTNQEILNSPVYHFVKRDVFGNGNLGVNFFFVLSGFLITYLLIQEKRKAGKIHVPYFWLRRVLRIWPLYYFCVFFGFVVFPFIKSMLGQTPHETAHLGYYLTFLNNFDFIKNGLPDASVLGVLWSVAIEEQFYFIWPLLLTLVPVRWYWIPFSLIIAGSWIFRGVYNTELMLEHHTFSCMGDLTIGAFGAWLYLSREGFARFVKNMSPFFIGCIYLLFILIFFFRDEWLMVNPYVRIFERSFIALIILFIILEQSFSQRSLFKMSSLKIITRLGMVTYGLYCLHFIGILITLTLTRKLGLNQSMWQVFFLETILSLAITIGLSLLSYRYFERFFLRLKDRFSILQTSRTSGNTKQTNS